MELSALAYQMFWLLCIALLISSIGFYRVVYFISIGYAFSIVVMSLAAPLFYVENLTWASIVQNVLLLIWGLRLGIFLVRREYRASYRKELAGVHARSAGMKWNRKLLIWIAVSVLYVLMFSPSLFTLVGSTNAASAVVTFVQLVGLIVMASGLAIETLADSQKSAFKARHPDRFCDAGLYRWVRCPNYLGEILVWIGSWIVGLVFYANVWMWAASLIGVVCITLIMMGSTKRLEASQKDRYGGQLEYQEYIRSVPILFPFVPVYSLENVRVFLE